MRLHPECVWFRRAAEETRNQNYVGSANGNRTRISALRGPRANRCTIAPNDEPSFYLVAGSFRHLAALQTQSLVRTLRGRRRRLAECLQTQHLEHNERGEARTSENIAAPESLRILR